MRTRDPQFNNRCLIFTGLALITFCLYAPVLFHQFVNYDDQQYVTDNPRVQAGLTWRGFVWSFGFYAGNWHPLAWLSHMLDCECYGAWAGGHHLTSLLIHITSALLLFTLLNRMTQALWRSAMVAALFAWHPLHVESVAWVAERKDVLCASFWMLTLLAYHAYVTNRRSSPALKGPPAASRFTMGAKWWYTVSLACFVLALLSKPMAVTLPLVLLLLDFWPLKRRPAPGNRARFLAGLVGEKIPFLLLAAGDCLLTLRAQQIAIVSTAGLTVSQRAAHAALAYAHYLWAALVPVKLAVYYPYQIHVSAGAVAAAGAVLAAVTVLGLVNLRQRPYLIVGWLWFLGALVPVIGLVQVGDQAWADRYTYLPLVGVFVMAVWLVADWVKRRLVLLAVFAGVAGAMIVLTARQVECWQDTRTLFEHAKAVTPRNYLAITMLGSILAEEHQYAEAIACYRQALEYEPTFPEAHFFMGAVLDEQGRLDEALAEYRQALWFKPTQEQTHIFMGIALGKEKKYEEAVAHYTAALNLNPDSAVAHNNLARLYHTEGRFEEAISHYQAALQLDPKLALAHNNLGILLIQKGLLAAGVDQLRAALRLKPGSSETRFNLAVALNQQERWSEAADLFSQVMGSHAQDANTHYQFALALDHSKKTRAAMSEYASALLLQPDSPNALDGLAWILSTDPNPEFRNGSEAVKMAYHACELTSRNDPAKLKTLAAAYAETADFAAAANAAAAAQKLAGKLNRPELATECGQMLEQFKHAASWRR